MKKLILIMSLMVFLTSCSNNEYVKTLPPRDKSIYAFKGFKWSPDGAQAAVYMNDRLYIITPDGNQTIESEKINESQFEKHNWQLRDGRYVFVLRSTKNLLPTERNNEGISNDNNSELSYSKDRKQVDVEFHENFYEEQINGEQGVYLSYTGKYFEAIRVNFNKKEYVTLFNSIHILFGLNTYRDNVYFLGVNPKDDTYKYVLYKIVDDKVERVSIRPYTRHK